MYRTICLYWQMTLNLCVILKKWVKVAVLYFICSNLSPYFFIQSKHKTKILTLFNLLLSRFYGFDRWVHFFSFSFFFFLRYLYMGKTKGIFTHLKWVINLWVLISLSSKIFNHRIRDLEFESHLHQNSI